MAQQCALPRLRRSTLERENRASITEFHPLADQQNGPPTGAQLPYYPVPVRVSGPFAALPEPHLALGSIAAPATATVFLLVSLSKTPRSFRGTLKVMPRGISDQG